MIRAIAVFLSVMAAGYPGPLLRAQTPAETVAAFHLALESGDSARAMTFLDPEAVIFEGGGVERSRDEYASHHLGADMAFSAATNREVVSTFSETQGRLAVVLTEARITGTYRDREMDHASKETVVLWLSDDDEWRIVHIHWSSRANRRG